MPQANESVDPSPDKLIQMKNAIND